MTTAERLAERIGQLTTAQRTFQRNGVQFRIHSFGVEDWNGRKAFRVELSAQKDGTVLIARDSPRNPFYFIDPPLRVPDGEETNPDYNALDPQSPLTRTKYREDLVEAAKIILSRMV